MAMNDILSALLTRLGLKTSEKDLCERAIRLHEENLKDLHDRLQEQMDEVKSLETRLRKLKSDYDVATPASKTLYEAQIRSLMKDFERARERQRLTLRNIEKEKALLQNRRLEAENLDHPTDVAAVEESEDRKDELLDDLQEEDASLEALAGKTYGCSSDEEETCETKTTRRDDDLSADVAAILGEEPVKKAEPLSEQQLETA